jgi:hypothetical protein
LEWCFAFWTGEAYEGGSGEVGLCEWWSEWE